ncbi:MAG: hypothetical protein ACRAVC_24095 [Trichormus sp.]
MIVHEFFNPCPMPNAQCPMPNAQCLILKTYEFKSEQRIFVVR